MDRAGVPLFYPLGQSRVQLRAIAGRGDVDIACSVHSGEGHELGVIRSRSRVPAVLGRETGTLEFDLLRPTGAIVLTFTRIGGATKRHLVEVRDGSGRPHGRLRQTSSYWRLFRTQRVSMALEDGGSVLGATDVCIDPNDPFTRVSAPVTDRSGAVLATVERTYRYADSPNNFFDYLLHCPQPLPAPLPDLLVATAFAHYLYDRLAVGGPLEAMNRFGRGPGRF